MENLKEQLELHKDWLQDNSKGKRLDFKYADLSGANFKYANFKYANLKYANLKYANLSGTTLSGANLIGANLIGANLSGANLSGANLSGANLKYADLSGANLSDANLSGANLIGANLKYCIGNNREIKSLQLGTYLISYTKDILNIGCQSYSHSEWITFSDTRILEMDEQKALDWWNLNKAIIFELIGRE